MCTAPLYLDFIPSIDCDTNTCKVYLDVSEDWTVEATYSFWIQAAITGGSTTVITYISAAIQLVCGPDSADVFDNSPNP